jgi:hypothetical protein
LVKLVRRADIEAACGLRGVAACTAFVGQRLDCACEKSAGGWQIRAHAQFIPLMYLSDSTWASHELDHVGDVREALTAHVLRLELRLFESKEACERESARETEGFGATMDRFKLDSNAARHPRFAKLIQPR